jgi:hypothetical protein
MRHLWSKAPLGALLASVALFAGPSVKADIIPLFDVVVDNGDGTCTFNYNVEVSGGTRVNTGDYFTIYDFNGYIAGSAFAPADWAIATPLTGVTPGNQIVVDDPSIVNLTFTYTGAATIFGPVFPLGGPDAFGADSKFCRPFVGGQYASSTHKNNPGKPDNNTPQENQGSVVTPAVPEASSLALLLPGLVPLGIVLRRRSRKE